MAVARRSLMLAINRVISTDRFGPQSRSSLFEQRSMIVSKRRTERLKKRAFKFAVLCLFVFLASSRLVGQTDEDCKELRDKWMDEQRAAVALEGEAKAQAKAQEENFIVLHKNWTAD